MEVICDHVERQCDGRCSHRNPHPPIYDLYGFDAGMMVVEGFCHSHESECGWRIDTPTCKCVPVKGGE